MCSSIRSSFPDVLVNAANSGFGREHVACCVDRNALAHRAIRSLGLVWRHEHRHLAVLDAADAYALEPAGVTLRCRLRIGCIDQIVRVDRDAAHAAELAILAEV